jgi:hypothetical protein
MYRVAQVFIKGGGKNTSRDAFMYVKAHEKHECGMAGYGRRMAAAIVCHRLTAALKQS